MRIPASLEEQVEVLRREWAGRPVWVAGSTHEGEDELVLFAHHQVLARFPDALLILVPRHRERLVAVGELLNRSGLSFVRRSEDRACGPGHSIFLGDTLGELLMFYAAADVAFVAGSLAPIGGHNLLEPAALGIPVLTGPYNFNAEDVVTKLVEGGAAQIVRDVDDLVSSVVPFLADPGLGAEWGARGRRIVSENRGALRRLLDMVEPLLDGSWTERALSP